MLEPGSEIDRYVVDAKIGEGGVAAVYRVHHRTLGTVFALKVLAVSTSRARRRAAREARSQASLDHPFIVQVLDTFEEHGVTCLLMDYIRGPSLRQLLDVYQPSLPESIALFRGIVTGVAHAHHHGLVHRDIKPGNILLQPEETGLIPKVSDFGLVKILGNANMAETATGVILGTPAYESPEQHRTPKDVDERTDIFALGCVLYELICGQRAFTDDNIHALYNTISNGAYEPVLAIRPDTPTALARAIDGMLEPERDRRTANAQAILDQLDTMEIGLPDARLPEAWIGRVLPEGTPGYVAATEISKSMWVEEAPSTAGTGQTFHLTKIEGSKGPVPSRRGPRSLVAMAVAVAALLIGIALWDGSQVPTPSPQPVAPVVAAPQPSTPMARPSPVPDPPPPAPPTSSEPTAVVPADSRATEPDALVEVDPAPEPIPAQERIPTDTDPPPSRDGGVWIAPIPAGSAYASIANRVDVASGQPAHPDVVVAIGSAAVTEAQQTWPETTVVSLNAPPASGVNTISRAPDPAELADRMAQLGLTTIGGIYSKKTRWWNALDAAVAGRGMSFNGRVCDAEHIESTVSALAAESDVIVVQPDRLWTASALTSLFGAALSQRGGPFPVVSWSPSHLTRRTAPTMAAFADIDSQIDLAAGAVDALSRGEEPSLPWPKLQLTAQLSSLQQARIIITRRNKSAIDDLRTR